MPSLPSAYPALKFQCAWGFPRAAAAHLRSALRAKREEIRERRYRDARTMHTTEFFFQLRVRRCRNSHPASIDSKSELLTVQPRIMSVRRRNLPPLDRTTAPWFVAASVFTSV